MPAPTRTHDKNIVAAASSEHDQVASVVAVQALAIAALIGFSAWLTIALTRPTGGVTIIWLASGLLAGILLTSPHRVWPAYIVAALAGNLIARAVYGDPLLAVVGRGVASTLEACIVVYALRYFVGNVSDPTKLRLVARVAMSSTLLACAISALIAAATSSALSNASFTAIFIEWFTSHTLGIVIFATVVGIARDLGTSVFGRPGRHWKFARSMGLVVVTTLLVFSQSDYPLLFLIYPPMLFAVYRHHFAGLAIGITLVVVISVLATKAGTGPLILVAEGSLQRILVLQAFIAITSLTTLPVAIMLAERGRLAAKLRDSLTEIQAVKQELMHIAQHDSLTGLGNRNKFNERLTLALAKCRRHGHPIALLYLDIDHFKEINDTLGHAIGDAVLCEFALRLRANVRETDFAARLGGDEFVLIVEDIDAPEAPEIIAQKVIDSLKPAFTIDCVRLRVTASIGIGVARVGAGAQALLSHADDALYEAKSAGRNTYRIAAMR